MDPRGTMGKHLQASVEAETGEITKRGLPLDFKGKNGISRTQQHYAAGTRVDNILRQYETKGVDANSIGLYRWAHQPAPQYGIQQDFDYQTQLNNVIKVKEYFASLPSRTREMFRNDPGRMLEFMTNPKNKKACQELGLLPKDQPKPLPKDQPKPEKPEKGETPKTPDTKGDTKQ